MSLPSLEPMAPDILAALDVERRRPDLAPKAQHRLLSRIEGAIRVLAVPVAAHSASAPAFRRWALSGARARAMAIFSAGTLVGGAGGAALHAALSRPQAPASPAVAEATAPVASAPTVAPPPVAPPPKAPLRAATAAAHVAPTPLPERSPDADFDLARERALLEMARAALARGRADEALAALARHAAEYPQGRLVEEREAMYIQALATQGRVEEARKASESFRKRYPESILLPLLDAVMQSPEEESETESPGSPQ